MDGKLTICNLNLQKQKELKNVTEQHSINCQIVKIL